MKIKLKDIAQELDLSVAAVSMAINNKSGVSEATRTLVVETAKRMGYVIKPESRERSIETKRFIKLLRVKKHGLVAMETAFFSAIIEGMEAQCQMEGYELLVSNLTIDENTRHLMHAAYHEDVDGMVVLSTELNAVDLEAIKDVGCPIVILDRRSTIHADAVLMNNRKALEQGVAHLVSMGHKRIGYLKSSVGIYNFDERFSSFTQALQNHHLSLKGEDIILAEPTMDGAKRDVMKILKTLNVNSLPTAFMADNDIIALGALNAFRENGIHVPEQVSIMGLDDMPFCTVVTPQITTIRIFKEAIGSHAVKLLLERIHQELPYTRHIEVDPELIIRESVKDIS